MQIDEDVLKILNEEDFKEPFYEMSMAWRSIQRGRCVWVENPTGYNNRYFKYLNDTSYQKVDKVARISLSNLEYLKHKDFDDKKLWILNSKEKKELVTLINSPSEEYPQLTNWQQTLYTYNRDNFEIPLNEILNNSFDRKKFPYAMDLNTPMPDYTKLK